MTILKNSLNAKLSDVSIYNIDYKDTRYLHANCDAFKPCCFMSQGGICLSVGDDYVTMGAKCYNTLIDS